MKWFLPLFFILFFIVLWQIAFSLNWFNPLFLPSPLNVLQTFWFDIISGNIFPDFLTTLYRFLIGFFISVIIGVGLGILMGYDKRIYSIFNMPVDFFRSIPPIALFPLFLLFFGIGDNVKIAVEIWTCSLVILVNTMYGVHNASKIRLMVAKSMRAKKWLLFRKVILPEILPYVFSGIRIAIGLGLIVVIVTEMFIGTNLGLGHRLMISQSIYDTPELYASILFTGILGYVLNQLFLFYERKTLHWTGK